MEEEIQMLYENNVQNESSIWHYVHTFRNNNYEKKL